MKKNLYYAGVFKRKSVVKEFILVIFTALVSMPRLLLEVFIRKSFGERYFSLFQAIGLALFLCFLPVAIDKVAIGFGGSMSLSEIIFRNITWYLFLAGFIYCSLRRQQEIKREPSVFDFAKFSLSTGIINPAFYGIRINGKAPETRFVATVLEPLFFLAIGLVMTLLMQKVGILIIVCSLCYSVSYHWAYQIGDHMVMDMIDEMICNEELVKAFVDGRRPDQTRGFDPFCRRPANPEFRRKVADHMLQNVETADVF